MVIKEGLDLIKETREYVESLERHLHKHIEDLQGKEDFSHLNCEINCEIINSSDENSPYKMTSNAGFSITKSIAFDQAIRDFFEKNKASLNANLPGGILLSTSFVFSEGRVPPVEKEEKPSDEESIATFTPETPRYSFDQVYLPDAVKNEIEEALNLLRYQKLIYEQWGFSQVDPIPKSVLNFYGPPGTGKTMCAHAVAHSMGRPLLALNYSEIESKYVGEAPKNLTKAFATAKETNSVVFFDEADSFLGKRIENVTQGAEQALNSLRSQMLILLEEFSGIVLFATNLVTNFDKAFESRILKHIKFELPDENARMHIIEKKLPAQIPFAKPYTFEDLRCISQAGEGFSGREIKSAILETLLSKATKEGEQATFSIEDFATRFRMKKEEKERLLEEERKRKEQKILNALRRKGDETQSDSEEVTDKEENASEQTSDSELESNQETEDTQTLGQASSEHLPEAEQ